MPVLERHISLKVPIESVFQYLGDPAHFMNLSPDSLEIREVRRQSPASVKFAWVYKMMGIRLFGEAELNETLHGRQLDLRFWGGMHGSIVWQLQTGNEGTILHLRLEYMVPAPLLKKHTEEMICQQNEMAVEQLLGNLKARLETEALSAKADG